MTVLDRCHGRREFLAARFFAKIQKMVFHGMISSDWPRFGMMHRWRRICTDKFIYRGLPIGELSFGFQKIRE
jgi:hypothetical protein